MRRARRVGPDRTVDRRAVLGAAGTLATTALAGCLGGGGTSAEAGPGDGPAATGEGTTGTTTPDPNRLENHPAAAEFATQPTLGPHPFEAEAVIVAFEDPSCSRCRAFEERTVPKIESELVEPGRGSFVFRGYPVVYPWGKPATKALEATYARDADAFWSLLDHYFAEQSAFGTENVLDRTGAFLAANTDLDADAVVADVEDGAFDEAVDTDLTGGREAGIGRSTPIVVLFRDGEYRTKAAGSVSYGVIESALGL